MKPPDNCPSCGAALPSDAGLTGVCPACAFGLALDRSGDEDPTIVFGAEPSEPSRIIGPYRLLQKIGEGGMGEVWQAEQTEPMRRRVALKIIKAGMDTRQVIARFEAERQALALMDHPCVSKVLDAGSTPEGRPYFVMEYVSGLPITEHCDRHTLTTDERLALFMQVCAGVQHAHQKAIIHRDLKPSNVLVSLVDGVAVPKIIDFGVAKARAQRLTEKTLFTELGVLIGTPEYMSPEQADLTVQDIDTRSDVYALGVMLYELLAGALPFDSKALREAGFDGVRRMIREVEPPKPSTRLSTLGGELSAETAKHRRVDLPTLRRQIAGELDWITMKALEKERARRYGSPAELAADLERHLRHEPVLAGPPSATYRARKYVRRHRFGVAVACIGILALGGFAAAMAVQSARTAREAEAKRRVSEFLTDLFEVSDPSEAKGKTITARELLDKGAAKIRGTLSDDPAMRAELMATMGVVYLKLGLMAQAEPLLKEALDTRRRILGPNHRDTLGTASATGRLYMSQGLNKEAEALFRETLDLRKRVLGHEHVETLRSMDDLATMYFYLGRYNEAAALHRETLDKQRRVLGPEHTDTLRSMNGLAVAYSGQGQWKEAAALHRELLDIQKRVLGPEDLATVISMYNLGFEYEALGRHKEGEALHRVVLDIKRRVLGPEHPGTLASMIAVANYSLSQGRYEEAERLYRETLDIEKRVLGPEHPMTLQSDIALADTYRAQGRHAKAEALLREVLMIQRRVLGPEHPTTLMTMGSLAITYRAQSRHKEAVALLREVVDMARRVLGPEHSHTLRAMTSLAYAYHAEGRDKEAEALFRELIEPAQRVFGPGNPNTCGAFYALACLAALRGQRTEALHDLRKGVDHGCSGATRMLEEPDLASLRSDPEFARIVATAKANGERADPTQSEPSVPR